LEFILSTNTAVTFDPSLVVTFTGSSDFSHTAVLNSVRLLDENHQPVANPTLVAESGTIYPLAGVAAVPEPSSVTLVLEGALAIWAARRLFLSNPTASSKAISCS
jgi:hypothetical protein